MTTPLPFRRSPKENRPSARQRGYTRQWERESKAFLACPANRTCSCGCGQPADMVDHRIAPKGDMTLFWDRSNWQPMNRRCNIRKAVHCEGGFGRAPSNKPMSIIVKGSDAQGRPLDPRHPWAR